MNDSGRQNETPEEPRRGQGGPPRVPRPAFGWLLFAAIGLMLVLMLSGNWKQGAEEITIDQFQSLVENQQIVQAAAELGLTRQEVIAIRQAFRDKLAILRDLPKG